MGQPRSWTVREAGADDDAALGELFRIVFGFDRGAEHHRWKFRDNPAGPPVIAIAESSGKIVGQYALWPTALRLGSEIVSGAQSLDTMTHPDFRGQGMFVVLAEECMRYAAARGIEALYGFPNDNSQPGFVRRLDWDCSGRVAMWVRPLRVSRHKRVPKWAGAAADVAMRALPRGNAGVFELRREAPSALALAGLLEAWAAQKELCRIERTPAYYDWRFHAGSGMQYEHVCAYRDNQLAAMAVWGIDIRNGNGVLSELLAGDEGAAQAAVAGALSSAQGKECPLILACSSRASARAPLARCGFFRYGSIPFIVRKLTARTLGANVHTHANWDLFGADLDTF